MRRPSFSHFAEGDDALWAAAGELLVALGVGMLDVKQHQIGLGKRALELLGMRGIKGVTAAVEAGVHGLQELAGRVALRLTVKDGKEVRQEVGLQKRLAARNGHAAVFVEAPLALELVG